MTRAEELIQEAIKLDPLFVRAYANLAVIVLEQYRVHKRNPSYLRIAEEAVEKIREIDGENGEWYRAASMLARIKGDLEQAIMLAKKATDSTTAHSRSHDVLAFALKAAGDYKASVQAMIRHAEYNPDVDAYNRLLIHLSELGDPEDLKVYAEKARPIFERHLKLNPDDLYHASTFASVLYWIGENAAALTETLRLLKTGIDGQPRYNLCCLLCDLGEKTLAIDALRSSIDGGYSDIETILNDPDLDPIRSDPAFTEIVDIVRDRIGKQNMLTAEPNV
jgi:tetratricopeptide (TPR) repeat protein